MNLLPDAVMEFDTLLSEAEIERIQRRWKDNYAGKLMVLHGGVKYTSTESAAPVIVKCDHCGQWAARKTACKHCGAPV